MQKYVLPLALLVIITTIFFIASPGQTNSFEKPEDNRFTPVILTQGTTLDEPMAFEVLDDERVFIIERKGGVKLYNPTSNSVQLIATIPVNTKYTSAEGNVREAEEGLVGLTIHPEFDAKPWVYLLYADPDEPKHVLARWDFQGNKLVESTKKVVLEYPVQREACCHTGGGMVWDNDGNLFITVGNNTANSRSSQTDERPGRSSWDDQRGASNTNDLRGKILRIHPEDDGSYSIPEGNLFPEGTADTKPEIFSMGHRNPWRISIDSKTGYLYWGEVGPDATEDTELGPMGYDELNQGRGPGNYGWPYFIGENHAFPYFDYESDTPRDPKDPDKPVNTSVNNTGLQELPPALPAFISYPYGVSEQFPLLGTGGRSATGGPIYRKADFENPTRPFPAYYEGRWLAADLSRGWIMSILIDDNGDYVSMERFLPDYKPAEIIDIKFGPNGDLYVLEYGSRWFRDSEDDKLIRIEYNAGNRKPLVAVSSEKQGGKAPFETRLLSEGTMDYDGDKLKYEWTVVAEADGSTRTFTEPDPLVRFEEKGTYTATLTVTDPSGASNSASLELLAGNAPPSLDLAVTGNQSFFFPDTGFDYTVLVQDEEDGASIDPSQVAVSIDYVSEGFDYAEVIQGQRSVDASTRFAVAKALMGQTDCSVCHQENVRSAGPSYQEIADRYITTPEIVATLAEKVRNGGSGVWGEINMPAHPSISENDAALIVEYILQVDAQMKNTLPLNGSYTPFVQEPDNGRGSVIVRAAYADRGAGDIPSQSVEKVVVLRSASLRAGEADLMEGVRTTISGRGAGPLNVIPSHGGYIAFKDIDLTSVVAAELTVQARTRDGSVGGILEFRLGNPEGELLGSQTIEATEFRFRRPPTATQIQEGGGATQASSNAGGNISQNAAANRPNNAPAAGGGNFRFRGSAPTIVPLQETTGVHDLYLVFINDQVRNIDPLFSLTRIDFKNSTP